MDGELKQYLDGLSERIEQNAAEFRQMREENAGEFQRIATEFRQVREENAAAHAETRRHFDSTAERFESKFELLSEGIQNIDQKLGREAADIRAEMRQGFADTHALIRFSHAQRTRGAKR
jgi:uncharacterized protein YukE